MATQTVALVGAAGGVGTTRLSVESAATLARAGWDVAVFDAAFATQGLAAYIDGRIDEDVTALATGAAELEQARYGLGLDTPGYVDICPARAPFERLARAKTAGAAERFEQQVAAASLSYDAVIVDTPPVAANQALAAVNTADAVGLITTDNERGADAYALAHDRLADIGHPASTVIANRSSNDGPLDADVSVPESAVKRSRDRPTSLQNETPFAPAVATAVERLFDVSLDLEFDGAGRLERFVGSQ